MEKDIRRLDKVFDKIKNKLKEIYEGWDDSDFKKQIKLSISVLKKLNVELENYIAYLLREYEENYELITGKCELCWENHNEEDDYEN